MRDLYEVLQVEKGASQPDLKKAYRKLAQEFHPDKNPDDKSAEDKFKECANAYQILSDDDQRAAYDRYGFEGLRGRGQGGPQNVEDVFSAFGDLFGDFFGGRGGQGGRRQPRGADLRIDLELAFPEAVWGVTKEVKVSRDIPCTGCQGSGAAAGTKPEVCKTCQGKGQVVHSQGFFIVAAPASRSKKRALIVEVAGFSPRPRRYRSPCRRASTMARPCASQAKARPHRVAPPVICTSCSTSRATGGSSATKPTSSPRFRSASSRPRSAVKSKSTRSTRT